MLQRLDDSLDLDESNDILLFVNYCCLNYSYDTTIRLLHFDGDSYCERKLIAENIITIPGIIIMDDDLITFVHNVTYFFTSSSSEFGGETVM